MIRHSENDSGSESESASNKGSRSPSPNHSQGAARSRSSSHSRPNSRASGTSRSRSRSRSPSNDSAKSKRLSRSPSNDSAKSKTHSRSPSNDSAKSKTHSRSPSNDSVKSKTHSRSPSNDSAKSKIHSRSPSNDSAKSKIHSRSPSQHSVRSKSRSRSASAHSVHSAHSKSRSRSASQQSQHSDSGSDVGGEKRKRQVLSDSGSDGEKAIPKKKKSALIDSDSEPDENVAQQEEEDVDATELFGDADDISTDEETRGKGKNRSSSEDDVRRGSDNDDDRRSRRSSASDDNRRMSDDEHTQRQKEKEVEPEPIPERRIDVEIPRIISDLGKEIHFVKLPNFLSVETRPFDRDTYEDEIDEEETLDEEGRQRIKLKVSNTIRWREYFDDDGNVKRESNARMVRWDDGSISLHLGNEIFDVYKQPLQGDFNHLFIRQGTGLQGQAVFRTKLTFRPYSTESFTHKKMTMSLADRSQKTAGIKILTTVGSDPDANRYTKLKKEEEQLRQAMRQKTMQSKPKRNRDTTAGHSAGYREEHDSDDEGAISIAAIKNKYTGKGAANTSKQGATIYSSDEDESDFETRRNKKTDRAKVLRAIADSDDESVDSNRNAGSGNDSNANESKSGSESD